MNQTAEISERDKTTNNTHAPPAAAAVFEWILNLNLNSQETLSQLKKQHPSVPVHEHVLRTTMGSMGSDCKHNDNATLFVIAF